MSEIDAAIREINKAMGEGTLYRADRIPPRKHLPSGIFLLDLATLGGVPEGLGFMVYGPESSGKTTLIDRYIASHQRKYPMKRQALIDTETTFDPNWAERHGVNITKLFVGRGKHGNASADIFIRMMKALECGLVIGDSIPGFVPKAITEASMEDEQMAILPRLIGKLCSNILSVWAEEMTDRQHEITVGFVNQNRSKVGFVLGDPNTLPGGKQINYLVTTKIRLGSKEVKGKNAHGIEIHVANQHNFAITKCKIGTSIRTGEFLMTVDSGEKGHAPGHVDDTKTILTYAKMMNFITGGGGNYRVNDLLGRKAVRGHRFQFRTIDEMVAWYDDNPADALWIQQLIIGRQRSESFLPAVPPDGYLLAPLSDRQQHILTTNFPQRVATPQQYEALVIDEQDGEPEDDAYFDVPEETAPRRGRAPRNQQAPAPVVTPGRRRRVRG